MKVILPFVLVLAAAACVRADDPDIPRVTAYGTAVTEAKPDLLRWHVSVSNDGRDLPAVSQAHTELAASVLRLLAEKGIRSEETQTSGMRFQESREFRGSSWLKLGYMATTQVSFTLRNAAEYRDLWIELSRLPGVSVDNVRWDVADRIAIQNTTRVEALRSARAKAEQMATTLGGRIAEPLVIEEILTDSPWAPQPMMANAMAARAPGAEGGDVIAPGAVDIRTQVRVVYRLVAP
ncbi:MAG TPA: SIMPL domain-containing protein [Opitutaceae bacterium]|nr:SIMPL domain-containing protein [Opitutaceae bacterium]